ncbi:hypothetical protein [Gandjariella thermophila]|uniref:hypothetical protein n=1 Tax=Gandjariella thermophila TaxID=1931992 RepID=UPI0010F6DFB8|nr:hypothetical protein [Gandjariella thermophila]
MEPKYREGGKVLIGPDGRSWREVTGWLEPDEVVSLSRSGTIIAVDECAGWSWDVPLDDSVLTRVVSADISHRLARRKYPEAVILAPSLWREYGSGEQLIVLSEETPKKKDVIEELRGDYGRS